MMKSSKIFAGCDNYLSQLETIRNVFNFVADYTLFELVTRFEIVIQAKEQMKNTLKSLCSLACLTSLTVRLSHPPAQGPVTKQRHG